MRSPTWPSSPNSSKHSASRRRSCRSRYTSPTARPSAQHARAHLAALSLHPSAHFGAVSPQVRLADASDKESVEAALKALSSTRSLAQLTAASKAKLLLDRYVQWLAKELRAGKTTLAEPLPTAEPVRVLCEQNLLGTRPLALTLHVLRLLYRMGGSGLLRRLLALPTEATPWVPVSERQRRPLQSSKKRTVISPFSLTLDDQPNRPSRALKEYARMHVLASEILEMRTTDPKQLSRVLEDLEALSARDAKPTTQQQSMICALVAASFHLRVTKPQRSEAQKYAFGSSEVVSDCLCLPLIASDCH